MGNRESDKQGNYSLLSHPRSALLALRFCLSLLPFPIPHSRFSAPR